MADVCLKPFLKMRTCYFRLESLNHNYKRSLHRKVRTIGFICKSEEMLHRMNPHEKMLQSCTISVAPTDPMNVRSHLNSTIWLWVAVYFQFTNTVLCHPSENYQRLPLLDLTGSYLFNNWRVQTFGYYGHKCWLLPRHYWIYGHSVSLVFLKSSDATRICAIYISPNNTDKQAEKVAMGELSLHNHNSNAKPGEHDIGRGRQADWGLKNTANRFLCCKSWQRVISNQCCALNSIEATLCATLTAPTEWNN